MAITGFPGDGDPNYPDWLQALLGNQANGGTPPGGSAQGYPASSGQQANMGYPAAGGGMGSPNVPSPMRMPPDQPAPAAPPPSGFWSWLKNIGSGPAVSPNGVMASGSTMSSPAPPAAQGYDPLSSIRPPVAGPLATPYRPEDSPSAGPVVNEPSIRARMPAAISPNATAAAPPAAAAPAAETYSRPTKFLQSITPAPAPSRFVQVDRPNMSVAGSGRSGAPQMTALNLAGLFGGGGQSAATPMGQGGGATPYGIVRQTIPASAAASVPGPLAPKSNYPMPPVMPDDVLAARRAAALANAGRHSGYQ